MKLDNDLLRDLIFKIEAEDVGEEVQFFDSELSGFPEDFQKKAAHGPKLDEKTRYHLREMETRGWIGFIEAQGFSYAKMLPQGHAAADFFRSNSWWRRGGRYLARWSDRILQSVVVPIVVSVVTVLVLRYFGLDVQQPPKP